jgi:hypothetical protein
MIDLERLKEALDAYKRDFAHHWKNERYKWEAVKHFQEHWDINAPDFAGMFYAATAKTGNLLASARFFPRGMIRDFAVADPEATRAMFIRLYDETRDLVERVENFLAEADAMRRKYGEGVWKNHFQNINAVSTYLWLRYPDRYYIYKYSECRAVAEGLRSDFIPGRGDAENLAGAFRLYDEICTHLAADRELLGMFRSALTDACHPDPELKTLTVDVVFHISRFFAQSTEAVEEEWFPQDYDPGISTETWLALLADEAVFTRESLQIMKRIKDFGGMATCTQLAERYGETPNFYNRGSSALAMRVARATGAPYMIGKTKSGGRFSMSANMRIHQRKAYSYGNFGKSSVVRWISTICPIFPCMPGFLLRRKGIASSVKTGTKPTHGKISSAKST